MVQKLDVVSHREWRSQRKAREFWVHRRFDAVLFDMDGTLVDTEPQTGEAIALVMRPLGVSAANLPTRLTSGRSWGSICDSLCEKYPQARGVGDLEQRLVDTWTELVGVADPITGAVWAMKEASRHLRVGVVSSSPRFLVDQLLEHIGLDHLVAPEARIGGEDVQRHKPEPEGFLKCAKILGVAPERTLVFEDSLAGVMAAKAAGACCVAVLQACGDVEHCQEHADWTVHNFEDLPEVFWRHIGGDEKAQEEQG